MDWENNLETNPFKQIENSANINNIAGRLPENSRNSFVDLQSQKNSKKKQTKKFRLFIEGWYFIFVQVAAASISCSQITFIKSDTCPFDLISELK